MEPTKQHCYVDALISVVSTTCQPKHINKDLAISRTSDLKTRASRAHVIQSCTGERRFPPGGLVVDEGMLSMHGRPSEPFITHLAEPAQAGDSIIYVDGAVDWQVIPNVLMGVQCHLEELLPHVLS